MTAHSVGWVDLKLELDARAIRLTARWAVQAHWNTARRERFAYFRKNVCGNGPCNVCLLQKKRLRHCILYLVLFCGMFEMFRRHMTLAK